MFDTERRQLFAGRHSPRRRSAYIAGGAITSVFTGAKINDIDLYFKSKAAFDLAVFQAYEEGMWCVSASKRAVTFSLHDEIVQMMHFDFFPTADDIFAAFDYTICMGAYDFDADEFVWHDDFLKHNSQRFLRFNAGTRFPLASAARVLKYQSRGYTIGKGDMMKIALAVRGVKIESWDDLKDQIGGAYGDKVVLGLEDKPFTLDAAIEALTVDAAEDEPWVQPDNDNMPATAEVLLERIAKLKGEEYVPSDLDADGWPIAA
ncbi:MAG: hypothetical protein ACAH27_05875 [Xanthobacteraceae bacterium]